MQPFPTAFWKTLGKESAPSPDSCLELETNLIADYSAETINTNKNDGSPSYFDEPGWVLQTPFVQIDRISGKKVHLEKYIKGVPHGNLDGHELSKYNGQCEFESLNEDVDGDTKVDRADGYTPISSLAQLKTVFQMDGDIWKWETVNPICQIEDGTDDCFERYVNSITKNFLYVWMRGIPPVEWVTADNHAEHPDKDIGDPLRYTDDIHKATHRENPFETSKSEDCKSCTIKLWFEKDAGQKVVELAHPDSASIDYPYGQLENDEIDQFIQEFGYNGYRSTVGSFHDHHYFYRQKATSKVTVTIGSPKTLTISIKGLGMDSNLDIWDMHLDPNKRIKEVLLGYYNPETDDEENIISNFNLKDAEANALEEYDLYNDFLTSRGDLQTLTIDHTVKPGWITTPIIKAMAPQLGVFLRDATEENFYKGPVRIFKWDPTIKKYWKGSVGNAVELAYTGDYTGVGNGGTSTENNHPINGLGYIPAAKFEGNNPLQAIKDGKSPYGTDYYKGSGQFYEVLNDQPGSFSSPYAYEHQVELGVGEHIFDLVFDSVVEYMNGGAYYDVTFTLGD